ncbi:heparinase II/III domain-containing protein [Paenibacillus sp. S-38]|uniref:heparinase II/III domain-containing protein n=1 Tax=Paenibacillus sp. S-38 TaxID=3416710 RepID=UPI003CE946C8
MNRAVKTGLRTKVEAYGWASSVVEVLKAELKSLAAAGALAVPSEPGGWWHQYVCPEHHTELEFSPLEVDAASFRCPHGCRLEGAEYRGAWLVFKHQSLARAALQGAAVYAAAGDTPAGELAKRLLLAYAEQFPRYEVHPDAQPWMLKGRAFHQALTEAIWSVTMLRAYLLLKEEGMVFAAEESAAIDLFLSMLESSMTEYRRILVQERRNIENNYTAWLNASLSCVYAVRGERSRLEELIEGEGGWKHHLSTGVNADGFEFEGSTYYHLFVLRAYLITAEMAERFGMDLYEASGAGGQSMRQMLQVFGSLADDTGRLPALHDGPMEREPYAREIAETVEQGLSRYGLPELKPILRDVYRQLGSGEGRRCGLEALLYGEGDDPAAVQPQGTGCSGSRRRDALLLPDSGFAVGRRPGSPLGFIADFGAHGGSHGHYDKLHLTLMHPGGTLTPDVGMVPYGSKLRREWFAETAAHNTVAIGGMSQQPHAGRCLRFEEREEALIVRLQSTDAYPGWRLERHLLLTDDWLLDCFEVALEPQQEEQAPQEPGEPGHELQWWMHPLVAPAGSPSTVLPAGAGTIVQTVGGTELPLAFAARYEPEPGPDGSLTVQLAYEPAGGGTLSHTVLLSPGERLYVVRTPGTSVDPSLELTALLHTRRGRRARFLHAYRAGSPVELKEVGPGAWLVTAGGRQRLCRLDEQGWNLIEGS